MRYLKYVFLVAIIGFIWHLGVLVFRDYDPFLAFFHLGKEISELRWDYIILGVALVGSLWINRFFCKYACPLGAVIGLLSRFGLSKEKPEVKGFMILKEIELATGVPADFILDHLDLTGVNTRHPVREFDKVKRPRDIIAFFYYCIVAGANLSKLKAPEIKKAEFEYSRSLLRALGDEWSADYPSLLDFARILKGRPPRFKLALITDEEIDDLCLEISADNPPGNGILQHSAMRLVDCVIDAQAFKKY